MKTCVIYDSLHGNTEKIAQAIGHAVADAVPVLPAGDVTPSELGTFDLLIVGAPTHGGRPTQAVQDLLNRIPTSSIKGTRVAAFDTRVPARWVRIFGFAAPKIARKLQGMGATLIGQGEGFFVEATEGPLVAGELERAADWARHIAVSAE